MFKPITEPGDVPKVGAKTEDLNLDFKSVASATATAHYERAKDIAAFANASGGTILIGATEGPGNTLDGMKYMSEAEAKAVALNFQNTANTELSPRPQVVPQPIEHEPGQWVVAVNVWPFPLLPVAVRVVTIKGETPKEWVTWAYFVRIGTHNVTITPEQAAMLMIPSIRNTMTLLESIPKEERKRMVSDFKAEPALVRFVDLVEVNPLENSATFTAHLTNIGQPNPSTVRIPLGDIHLVWKTDKHQWAVSFNGKVSQSIAKGQLHYVPGEL